MIPISLTLQGFLSYHELTNVDFSGLEVACISGPNGAGKSSLLDAITWTLFGRARRNDDEALINDTSDSCLVALDFEYEGSRYRVERTKEKGKGAQLEFQIQNPDGDWTVLTEAGLRATEERIRNVLHLDYETFINSSFFLQGKADMFAQQTSAKRKEILSSILGLEIWESYRDESARRRRSSEEDLKVQRQLLEEILAELDQEDERMDRLDLLNQNLEKTTALLNEKEKARNLAQADYQKVKAENGKLEIVAAQLDANRKRLESIEKQITAREAELKEQETLLQKTDEIQKAYQTWQELRLKLEEWNKLAETYHQMQSTRAEYDAQVKAEEARLQQEEKNLLDIQREINPLQSSLPALQIELEEEKARLDGLEKQINQSSILEEKISRLQAGSSELKAENLRLKDRMLEIKNDMDTLSQTKGSQCPLCGQQLTDDHRQSILDQLKSQGKLLGDQYRENSSLVKENQESQEKLKGEIDALRKSQSELTALQRVVGQKDQRASDAQARLDKWQKEQEPRLKEVRASLKEKSFSKSVRVQLQAVESSISKLGYQVEQHERCRQEEHSARAVEEAYLSLEKAQTVVKALRREINTLQESHHELQNEVDRQTSLEDDLQVQVEAQQEKLPDMQAIEDELDTLRDEANNLRKLVGAAQQMVDVLKKQRERQKEINVQIKETQQQIANLKMLETAFGKDGIPALLIEQSLPEIETQANEILDRLTSGRMSITFETEREYKDKKRADKKQTLDILIRDASGHRREYELFSGGEAFRINFSIRLALSRVLAQRAGARLQTLVIDEGFGSQDAEGRQRLIEAINQISQDFAKILVITHLDELKDAFPSRIEVQKTQHGSKVEVIA